MHEIPQAAIFDLDGLMLDTEPIYDESWRDAASQLGAHLSHELLSSLVGTSMAESERAVMRACGAGFPLERFRVLWRERWLRIVSERGIAPKAGLEPMLSLCEDCGLAKGVATSSQRPEVLLSLEAGGIANRFDCVVTGDEVTRGKPAPDIYLLAARRLGAAPARCIAFEDSEAGLAAASAAGIPTILAPDAAVPSARSRDRAWRVVASLQEARDLLARRWGAGG